MALDYSHRCSDAVIRFTDKSGAPLAEQTIKADLRNHEFLFGCGATEAEWLADPVTQEQLDRMAAEGRKNMGDRITADMPTADTLNKLAEERYQKWLKLFNYGTLHVYWGRFEPERGKPQTERTMRAAKMLHRDGVQVKGHPLIWHTVTAPWLLDMTDDEILTECLNRVERDVTAFKGQIDMWDVINEVVIMPIFDKYDNGITRLCNKLGRFGIVREMFQKARECNPDATLLINDFNTTQAYEVLIEGLLEMGVPIDVIGIQSHQHQGFWGLEKLEQVLKRFERFGLPIHFTENTFVSGKIMPPEIDDLNDYVVDDWPSTPEGEARQAKDWYDMYTTLFSHPLVKGITAWDFTDGGWLGAPSGIIRRDGSIKPAYETLDKLINQDWHTTVELRTNADGVAKLSGFRGEYAFSAGDKTGSVKLTENMGETKVVLE